MFADHEKRITALEAMLAQMCRTGVVVSTNDKAGTVRVKFPDADDLQTFDLRVLFAKTIDGHDFQMPDVNEQVLCLFLPFALSQGFVLGSFYSEGDPVPSVANQDLWLKQFKDGGFISYNRKTGDLELFAKGRLLMSSEGNAYMDAPFFKVFERKG